ncbi:hypothetical protein [uncultured Arcticibacterium sp.]|uniref:hypothetical protein n=1 Tax=uncultured Arcticibacterium sp. TaxID=2173042 RepID=UPI0030FBC52D
MKKHIIILSLIILTSISAKAQYNGAVGVRFTDGPAVSAKFNVWGSSAFEVLVGGFGNGLKGTFLYEIHNPAFNSSRWRWYYGFGGHAGSSPVKRKNYDPVYNGEVFHLGLDGIVGLEHTFTEIPINISADWKPEVNFVNYTGLVLPVFGFTGRFAF